MMQTNLEYQRVIPRDLFNEAKLLKCMGLLCLKIHDSQAPCEMKASTNGEAFIINLRFDGVLIVSNIEISIKGSIYQFKTIYNSKSNYPLYVEHEDVDYLVFNNAGEWDNDFIEFCNNIKPFIEVDNIANFEFWLSCFRPRTKKWMREQLRLLKSGVGLLGTDPETPDKIKALKFLLR